MLEKTKTKRNRREHEDDASEIHAERSRIFYLIGNMESAFTEMSAAIAGLSERDTKETVILYESKAMYDQSLGMIHEKAKHPDLAREAYAHALEEDLAYYSAHSRMASLQLASGDTANAITEMELAVQLQPNDPVLLYNYATTLVRARRDAEAATELGKSVAADSFYAQPHMLLARMADVEQYTDEAVKEYQIFLSLAARSDPQVALASSVRPGGRGVLRQVPLRGPSPRLLAPGGRSRWSTWCPTAPSCSAASSSAASRSRPCSARRTGLPALFVRKKAKEYGTCKLAEGPDVAGRRVTLVEDVITTGGAVRDATRALREAGRGRRDRACARSTAARRGRTRWPTSASRSARC